MKIFKEKQTEKKSWAIKLTEEDDDVVLQAVDSETEGKITNLIIFYANGSVVRAVNVKALLEINGYNPYEHYNFFCERNRIGFDE